MTQRPSIKRNLWIGRKYRIVDVHQPGFNDLTGMTVRVERQLPDSHWPHPYLCVEATLLSGKRFNERILLDGVRLQRETDPSEICRCTAYLSANGNPFPHRLRSGKCGGPPYCGLCGAHCKARSFRPTSDERPFDIPLPRLAWESECCNAGVYNDWQLIHQWEDES